MEKRKQIQERENRRLVALEKHKEWVQKKNEEVKRVKTMFFLYLDVVMLLYSQLF